MTTATFSLPSEVMECPLCFGKGQLKRAEVLERLGMKDFARIAQLSAEETFRLLCEKHKNDEQAVWTRFEAEVTKRIAETNQQHREQIQALQNEKIGLQLHIQGLESNQEVLLKTAKQSQRLETEKQLRVEMNTLDGRIKELEAATNLADNRKTLEIQQVRIELEEQLRSEQSQKENLHRRVEDYFREVTMLRERNQELETEMAKVARVGKKEEMDFAEDAMTWPGIWISEKLSKHGDYILAYRGLSGTYLEPRMIVDNKDKDSVVTEGDVDKLVRDAKERSTPVAVLVTRDAHQLRAIDKESRWACKDGIWILRTTRQWLPRDLEVLKPLFERMRTDGPDFLKGNSALANDIRKTLVDIDEIQKELKKAAKAIESASGLVTKYRERVQALCEAAVAQPVVPQSEEASTTLVMAS